MCQFINYLVQEWWNIQNSDMQQHYTLKALLQNLLECSICRFWKCIVRVVNTGSGELLSAHDKIKVTLRIWRRWNLLSAMFLSLWTCFKSFFSSFRVVGVDERSPNGAQIHNVWMWCKFIFSRAVTYFVSVTRWGSRGTSFLAGTTWTTRAWGLELLTKVREDFTTT